MTDPSHGYNPLSLADLFEPSVAPYRDGKQLRRYYRFRVDRWYGGVVTGDVVGCILRCGFCWAWRFSWRNNIGKLLAPDEAGEKLVRIARRRGLRQIRLSGGEPTLGFNHLLQVLDYVTSEGYHFILETNGILVGCKEDYAKRLAEYRGSNIEVRISIKGTSPDEFHLITGANVEAWYCQLRALQLLVNYGLKPGEEVYPAVMLSFAKEEGLTRIKRLLSAIHPDLAMNIDPEYVISYPHVEYMLRLRNLKPNKAYKPGQIPPEMI